MPSTPDPDERRRRRALLRAHHPDLGGDPAEFIRVMAAMQRGSSAPGDDVRFVRRPRGLARVVAWLQQRRHRRARPRRVT